MATYTVNITIDNSWVDNFNDGGTSLCMAKATKDASGKEVYNVVAKTLNQLAPSLQVTWTEEYQIQASTIVFNKGAKIQGFAAGKNIQFGETYHAEKWTKVQVFTDKENVPDDSIGFTNDMPASILLSMKDGSNWIPVYISSRQIPPGMTTLTPIPKVVFWFQQKIEASTMISTFRGKTISVSPDPENPVTINYNKVGEWSTVASSS